LAAGCAVVVKPAELTPLTTIALWHLLQPLDLPPGLANLVIGRPEPIGRVICSHPSVRLISFTGSTEVGRLLIAQSAPQVKRLALELGGNAPFLVMEDADLAAAADALMANKFRCAGQTCVCANRVLAHRRVAEEFTRAVAARVERLRVGNGLIEGTDIGPLITADAVEKVRRHVDDALSKGAAEVARGTADSAAVAQGTFFVPVVLRNVSPDAILLREETFGPVVAISLFDSEEQAITLANSTIHGLAAYLFTRDPQRIERMTRRLQFGHIAVNSGSGPTPEAPFGGMKQSGFGREGGPEGLLEFAEVQTVASA
ncbi:MAG: aldehyde dehydrogenase family protein, partial [Phycisphaerae bacterium]|nr:aldehyde dehydrogenase family protein [Phycisphaerae bacterium]